MFKRAVTVVVVLVAALSVGSPVSAYCPSISPDTCPTADDCYYWDSWCAMAGQCNNPRYCMFQIYTCNANNQFCTRGCLCF